MVELKANFTPLSSMQETKGGSKHGRHGNNIEVLQKVLRIGGRWAGWTAL